MTASFFLVLLGVAPLRGGHTKYSTKYRKNEGLKKLHFILHTERLHDMTNKVTVSQRHKTWQQKLLRIRTEQEDV
ncbi:MAG: hypothetical protein BHV93_14090 [Clostridiales bacterium 52_15]|nr:MAG: hypothetical protein BHV93_14090 [Clostridiales bacterium 52_15]